MLRPTHYLTKPQMEFKMSQSEAVTAGLAGATRASGWIHSTISCFSFLFSFSPVSSSVYSICDKSKDQI